MSKVSTVSNYVAVILLLTTVFNFFYTTYAQTCKPSGTLVGTDPPRHKCKDNCCKAGEVYKKYDCSPPVTSHTKATLTVNDFEEGGDGGAPSSCGSKYHSNKKPIVALSTGWYKSRCRKEIIIHGNGRTTRARVVDECDSRRGCDKDHGYQKPCRTDIVDASDAVWKALGVPHSSPQYGEIKITWTDA